MRLIQILSASIFGLTSTTIPAVATDIERNIVYIECDLGNDKTSKGSGVIISEQGHVLTAAHVTESAESCKGSIGVADPDDMQRLNFQPVQFPDKVDADVLQFRKQDVTYAAIPVCNFASDLVRKRIVLAGFPGETKTGAPSYREGVLSTALTTADGIVETDGHTTRGMSGGPVYSKGMDALIGTVIKADLNKVGLVDNYGILPISAFAAVLGGRVKLSNKPCHKPEPDFDAMQAQIKALTDQLIELQTSLATVSSTTEKHSEKLDSMGDHPKRLGSAENKLTEIESNLVWSAEIDMKFGGIRVHYRKPIKGEISVESITARVSYFPNEVDIFDESVVNSAKTLLQTRKNLEPNEGDTHALGASFKLESLISDELISKRIRANPDGFFLDHPVRQIEITLKPKINGELGQLVTLPILIDPARWREIDNAVPGNS